jgi:hypothetical protein
MPKKTEAVEQGKQKKYKAQKIHKINHPKICTPKNLHPARPARCSAALCADVGLKKKKAESVAPLARPSFPSVDCTAAFS